MNITLTTLDVISVVTWYKNIREKEEKPLSELPMKTQWAIKKNMDKLNPISQSFFNFREEAENELRQEYATDEKSEDIVNEETGKTTRQVKAEYMEDYQNKINELNIKLTEIVAEKNDIDLDIIDLDTVIEENGDKFKNLTIDDLDIINFMAKKPTEENE